MRQQWSEVLGGGEVGKGRGQSGPRVGVSGCVCTQPVRYLDLWAILESLPFTLSEMSGHWNILSRVT